MRISSTRRNVTVLGSGLAALALVLSGCGQTGGSDTASPSASASASTSASATESASASSTATSSASSSASATPSETATADAHGAAWGYEGANGPSAWGELDKEFETCSAGTEQSPVDVAKATAKDMENLSFDYKAGDLEIVNNGHTQQVIVPEGSTMKVDGVERKLLQFHFHTPSEHTVDGKQAEAEVHFVHQGQDEGDLAVVGALITDGEADNEAYAPLIDNLMQEKGDPKKVEGVTIDPAKLLPEDKVYTTYPGSLTTPPCSEGVSWFVLDKPVELSQDQLDKLHKVMGDNARPVQDKNGRELKEDSTP